MVDLPKKLYPLYSFPCICFCVSGYLGLQLNIVNILIPPTIVFSFVEKKFTKIEYW